MYMQNGFSSWSITVLAIFTVRFQVTEHLLQLPPIRYNSELFIALSVNAHNVVTSQPNRLPPGDDVRVFWSANPRIFNAEFLFIRNIRI